MLAWIVLHSLHVREHLGELSAGDVRGEFESTDLVRAHLLGVALGALPDHLEVRQQLLGFDLLAQALAAGRSVRCPRAVSGGCSLFRFAISHLRHPRVSGFRR